MKWEFRVWDLLRQQMFNVEKIEVSRIETAVKIRLPEGFKTLINSKRDLNKKQFLLMESTGVIDKNGSPIFSEDIILLAENRLAVVYYQPTKAAFVARRLGSTEDDLFPPKGSLAGHLTKVRYLEEIPLYEVIDSKVVGNVYENPNLLGGKVYEHEAASEGNGTQG